MQLCNLRESDPRSAELTALGICGWLIAWSTALQPMHVTTRPPSKHPLDLARYPLLVNSFFVIVPIAFTALMIGFTAVANTHVKELIPLYLQLDAGLTNATKQFDLGRAVDFFALEELGLQLTTSIDEVAHWWRLSIMTLLGFDCLLIAVRHSSSSSLVLTLADHYSGIDSLLYRPEQEHHLARRESRGELAGKACAAPIILPIPPPDNLHRSFARDHLWY